MVEGIKGAMSGVAEANRELNDEYRDWNDDMRETHRGDKGKQENPRGGNEYYFVQKRYKRERPIWYIPTKEEEHIDRLVDRGLI